MKSTLLNMALLAMILIGCNSTPTQQSENSAPPDRNVQGLGLERGLILKTDKATPGYVLFTPLKADMTYLVNLDGDVVHTWKSEYGPSGWLHLKENGNLLRGGRDPYAPIYGGGGQGGIIQEFDWDGNVVWEYRYASEEHLAHHDVAVMPNGNLLTIAWESKTVEECIAAGRNPEQIPKAGLWPDKIIEIKPIGTDSASIVWEWHYWDHLIQDYDSTKQNYGKVSDHPELLDLNVLEIPEPMDAEDIKRFNERKAAGQTFTNATLDNRGSDCLHTNAIDYNPALDQIVFSSPDLDEIFIIDHGTTTEEAASHEGGRWGKGGDFLYRWGNPENYDNGDSTLHKLGGQHNVRWVEQGKPGQGHLTLFNNRVPNHTPPFSAVYELETPLSDSGYALNEANRFGPEEPVWQYIANDTLSFFGPFISGTHRLDNGNTFINEGPKGRFFEVNSDGDILWDYLTPFAGDVLMPDGTTPQPIGNFYYATFRSVHIHADHPALSGKQLVALNPQPEPWDEPVEDQPNED